LTQRGDDERTYCPEYREKAHCSNIKVKIDGVQSRRKLFLWGKQDQHQKTENNSESTLTQRSVKEVGRSGGRLRRNCDQEDQFTLKRNGDNHKREMKSIKSSSDGENGESGIGGARWGWVVQDRLEKKSHGLRHPALVVTWSVILY
jgi:hypothetical protein